jgi:Mycothiol maleylpyruvate isomerase N-terminal domain
MGSTRDQILRLLQEDQATWRELVSHVPPERMDEPGPMGEWSFRDLVGHLNSWRQRTIKRLEAAAAGRARPANAWPAGMNDDESLNDWFRQQNVGRAVGELLEEYDASFDRAAELISAIPEDSFLDEAEDSPGAFRWRDTDGELTSDFVNHLRDHVGDVRSWLARG